MNNNYVEENFQREKIDDGLTARNNRIFLFFDSATYSRVPEESPEEINFRKLREENKGETFSEMLIRLVEESGEKNFAIYIRANIDRRHFSKKTMVILCVNKTVPG